MKAVILCGGSGTRLWPVSRTSSPKQFVPLFNGKSLFQLTIERNQELVDGLIIVVNEKQLPLCKEQIPASLQNKTQFIIEPCGRNTAPAIALAAHLAQNDHLFVVPSDHLIKIQEAYVKTVTAAKELASDNALVTFGITPQYPETGYGYIEANGNDVLSFKEKPDYKTAEEYIASGNFYWNSGMFLFHSNMYLEELKKFSSEIYNQSKKALDSSIQEDNIYRIKEADMLAIPSDSIDYAVMEKSDFVKTIPSKFGWSDLGSFDALYSEFDKDSDGNTNANAIHLNSKDNLIISNKLVTTFDVENLLIVDTPDALLIGKRGESQKVKELLDKVKINNKDLLD